MIHKSTLLALPLGILLLTGCRSSKVATNDSATPLATPVTECITKVQSSGPSTSTLTAKASFDLTIGEKNVSVGGSLKMKKNEVIQLSMVALGVMEVARIEFTPDEVLLVDRLHQQYARARYTDLKFLQEAGVDFYSLQGLFWNQLFVPGTDGVVAADRFNLQQEGQSHILTVKDTKLLAYRFITDIATSLLKQTNVSSQDVTERTELNWRYNDFAEVDGKPFPNHVTISVDGTSKPLRIDMKLSRLSSSSSFSRTELSEKYKPMDLQSILSLVQNL